MVQQKVSWDEDVSRSLLRYAQTKIQIKLPLIPKQKDLHNIIYAVSKFSLSIIHPQNAHTAKLKIMSVSSQDFVTHADGNKTRHSYKDSKFQVILIIAGPLIT